MQVLTNSTIFWSQQPILPGLSLFFLSLKDVDPAYFLPYDTTLLKRFNKGLNFDDQIAEIN